MIDFNDVKKEWEKDPEYKREHEALEEEFALASVLIAARAEADMTQQQEAEKTATS